MEGMNNIDLGKMSDMKLQKVYTTFSLMADSPKYKANPAVKPLTQKLRDELVRRGLKNNETDKNQCNAAPVGHGVDPKMISRRTDPKKTVGKYKDFAFVLWRYHSASGFTYQVICDELDIETKNHPTAEAAMRDFTLQVREIEKDVRGNSKNNADDKKITYDTIVSKGDVEGVPYEVRRGKIKNPELQKKYGQFLFKGFVKGESTEARATKEEAEKLAKQEAESMKPFKTNSKENGADDDKQLRVRIEGLANKVKAKLADESRYLDELKRDAKIRSDDDGSLSHILEEVQSFARAFGIKQNSKENAMDKLTAMKKKILLSNASDTVKAKALKKVMSNAEKKLQVFLDGNWEYVFARNETKKDPIITKDKNKAIPAHGLEYFKSKFGNHEFRVV